MKQYLAIDIGASGGLLLLVGRAGRTEAERRDDVLVTEVVCRFDNGYVERGGHSCWDTERLLAEIDLGLQRLAEGGVAPVSLGIDTWGVDYVLIDDEGRMVGDSVAYRDHRTDGWPERLSEQIPDAELYAINGLQKQNFNTIYQLMAHNEVAPEELAAARRILLMPDWLHYRLSGVATNEYSNASTTGLVNAKTRDWDRELIARLGLPTAIFESISAPGSQSLPLSGAAGERFGGRTRVAGPTPHDTASAYVALPARDELTVRLSSGTWSLIGDILPEPILDEAARQANYTNEGGYGGTIRFLKNIMGLWLSQSLRRECFPGEPWDDLEARAQRSTATQLIDVNDPAFLAPTSMREALRGYLEARGELEGIEDIDLVNIVYRSLASSYADAIRELGAVTGRPYRAVHITGGGGKSDWLNRLCAEASGLEVFTGPTEGSAIGNALVQMMADGEVRDLAEAHALVRRSIQIGHVPAPRP